MSRTQTRAEAMMAAHGFLGVPVPTFEAGGRAQFLALLMAGLVPESKVLEFGCGVLRVGHWLVSFLDPDGYCGIEPAQQRVEHGLAYLLDPALVAFKRPRFSFNADFDASSFATRFDFVLAGSIWTHASKRQIATSLDTFVAHTNPGAVFLTSYLAAGSPEEDYQGDRWVGTSHESTTPGVIRHSVPWLLAECARRGLEARQVPGIDVDGQTWLQIRRA